METTETTTFTYADFRAIQVGDVFKWDRGDIFMVVVTPPEVVMGRWEVTYMQYNADGFFSAGHKRETSYTQLGDNSGVLPLRYWRWSRVAEDDLTDAMLNARDEVTEKWRYSAINRLRSRCNRYRKAIDYEITTGEEVRTRSGALHYSVTVDHQNTDYEEWWMDAEIAPTQTHTRGGYTWYVSPRYQAQFALGIVDKARACLAEMIEANSLSKLAHDA